MDLDTALSNILPNRKVILFLGAGFSNDTVNQLGLATPSGSQLSGRILERLGISGVANLGLAIDKLREKLSPIQGFSFIQDQLTVSQLTDEQKSVLSVPWTRIYTTNVDNIGSAFSNRHWHDAVVADTPVGFGDFVYLHGCITNCTAQNYYTNLKLGEQLYLMGYQSASSYHHMLRQDLYESDAVFVVGYSMADPDLASLFFNSDDLINKCFVFSGQPDELSAHRISLIGTNTNLGLADLTRLIKERPTRSSPPLRSEIVVDRGAFNTKEVSQTARQNLLIYGRYDENVARTSWTRVGEPQYAVARDISAKIAQLSPPRVAVIHSHLGNGKSLVFHYARFLLTKSGANAYSIKSDTAPEALKDVLREIPSGSHVFFEGDIFAVIDTVDVVEDRSLVLCATSRTTTTRVAVPAMTRVAGHLVQLYDANRLNHAEIVSFHDLIDSMGFWPEDLSTLRPEVRVGRLERDFDSNINAIVLKIFENKNVREQILTQWQFALRHLNPIMDHLIVASYMQLIDISVPAYILNEFQNIDYQILRGLENDIIRVFPSGRISFGNAIIGEFVLINHPKKNDIIGPIVRFCNFIDQHASQRSHQWIVRRLLRYWNLSRLLGSPTTPNEVLDRASYIPSVNADPLFWVQYSISQMENQNYLAADRYLSTAYARAEKRGGRFDPYQIDTHSARLTVRKIIANGMYDGASVDIIAAVAKLRSVIQRRPDDVYHVASVVSLMLKSPVAWGYVLNEMQYATFKRELENIGERLAIDSPGDVLFSTERQALDLIRQELQPK